MPPRFRGDFAPLDGSNALSAVAQLLLRTEPFTVNLINIFKACPGFALGAIYLDLYSQLKSKEPCLDIFPLIQGQGECSCDAIEHLQQTLLLFNGARASLAEISSSVISVSAGQAIAKSVPEGLRRKPRYSSISGNPRRPAFRWSCGCTMTVTNSGSTLSCASRSRSNIHFFGATEGRSGSRFATRWSRT
jgi:hypothetical protein